MVEGVKKGLFERGGVSRVLGSDWDLLRIVKVGKVRVMMVERVDKGGEDDVKGWRMREWGRVGEGRLGDVEVIWRWEVKGVGEGVVRNGFEVVEGDR